MTRAARAAGDVAGALAVLPKLRRELLAPSLAQLTAADPLATCEALERSPGLGCVTPLMVAHTAGGLAKPDVPVATRTALLRYLQSRAIYCGWRDRTLHDLYVVLLVLHPEEHELHRCAAHATGVTLRICHSTACRHRTGGGGPGRPALSCRVQAF